MAPAFCAPSFGGDEGRRDLEEGVPGAMTKNTGDDARRNAAAAAELTRINAALPRKAELSNNRRSLSCGHFH